VLKLAKWLKMANDTFTHTRAHTHTKKQSSEQCDSCKLSLIPNLTIIMFSLELMYCIVYSEYSNNNG